MTKADLPDEKKILGMLGLAARARRLIFGVPQICDAMRAGRRQQMPLLVLEAADTSANTHKRITDRCAFYRTPLVRLRTDGETLAHAVGHTGALAAVAVTDPRFCAALQPLTASAEPQTDPIPPGSPAG